MGYFWDIIQGWPDRTSVKVAAEEKAILFVHSQQVQSI